MGDRGLSRAIIAVIGVVVVAVIAVAVYLALQAQRPPAPTPQQPTPPARPSYSWKLAGIYSVSQGRAILGDVPYTAPPPTALVPADPDALRKLGVAKLPDITGTVYIGALVALTGDLSSLGENVKVVLEKTEAEANNWLSRVGAGFRVKILIEDTETRPSRS